MTTHSSSGDGRFSSSVVRDAYCTSRKSFPASGPGSSRIDPDRFQERAVTVAGSREWSWEEVSLLVSANANVIRFGIVLTGRGRVWLRNPELRLNGTRGQ